MCDRLARGGAVDWIEQPLPAADLEGAGRLRRETGVRLAADEALQRLPRGRDHQRAGLTHKALALHLPAKSRRQRDAPFGVHPMLVLPDVTDHAVTVGGTWWGEVG